MKVGPGDHQGTHEKSVSPSTGTPRHATSLSSSLYIMHFTSGHKTSLVVKNKTQPEPPTLQLSQCMGEWAIFVAVTKLESNPGKSNTNLTWPIQAGLTQEM